ncbi:MAG: hypothetical protein IPL36_04255 [Nigerium sp.]|nr:hypothetical protein [Nigerium sp.]
MSQPVPARSAGPADPGEQARRPGGRSRPGRGAGASMDAPGLDHPVLPTTRRPPEWWPPRRAMIGRIVGLVISAGLWGVIAWFNRDNLDAVFWVILGLSMGVTLVFLVVSIARTVRAKAELKNLHEGLALGIGRGGLHLDTYLAWEDVDHLVAVPGGGRGSGRLIVVATNGTWREVPIDWLSHAPSAVDGAVRALSGNRFHIDLDPLDA